MAESTTNSILNKPWINIVGTIVIAGLLWIPYIKSDNLQSAGMGAIILNWIPFLIAIVSIIFYLISRIFTKKRNWMICVLGVILNVIYVLGAI